MIVSEVMTTHLVTVTPDDSLSHVASLLRQHQFHHLPVVTVTKELETQVTRNTLPVLEGLITSHDIELAVAVGSENSSNGEQRPWQERRVEEVLNRSIMRVTPTTSIEAAAKMLVERGLNCLPVVEYEELLDTEQELDHEPRSYLVGLLTRSDLVMELAHILGAFEPGMNLLIPLPTGNPTSLAKMLLLAAELHIKVHNIILASPKKDVPRTARVRIGTINPSPLLLRLQQAGISYSYADFQSEGAIHG